MSVEFQIKKAAADLGFDLCGITNDFVPTHKNYFLDWLRAGKNGTMGWLLKNLGQRLSPNKLLDGTQSVVVVAANYKHDSQNNKYGYKIARYAHGLDYHDWIRQKLRSLEAKIQNLTNAQTKSFVDTGPVLERDLAMKAGLGWVGKNTLILHPAKGSYLFLGVVLTTAELQSDAPHADECLNCQLCVEACPTQALTPYQMDARACLSFQNIERRGPRDPQYYHAMGEQLVGCDICQDVCPYNRLAPSAENPNWFESFENFDWGSFENLLSLTESEYRKKSKGSAVSRIKYIDFMRNVFLVIGNLQRKDLREAILQWSKNHVEHLPVPELDWCLNQIA